MPYSTNADAVSTGYKGYAGIFEQRRKYDKSDLVIQKARVHAKMFNILSRNLTKMSVTDLEPRIFEFTLENDVMVIYNNPGEGQTFELKNEDAQLLQKNDKLFVLINNITAAPSQETLIVTYVGPPDSGSTKGVGYTDIVVRRADTPINITYGSQYSLIWGGYTSGENLGAAQPRAKEPSYTYNYLELFTKTVGESKDVENSQFYAKNFFSLQGQMTRARDLLMKQINMTFYLGQRNREVTEDGNYRHYTGGLYELIPTANKLDMAGNMTVSYWNYITSTLLFKHGNDRHEKFCTGGPAFMVQLENMFHDMGYELRVNEEISRFYGVKIKTFDFSGGILHFMREDSFLETGYSNSAFVWDMDFIAYMYLTGRDIQIDKDVTDKSEKWNKTKWLIYGRLGLFRAYDLAHFFLFNPSAPS